ncbi:DUF2785 domain-containing protein [Lysobacter solisilvae (ex Woo and Kim 2020)]|uniref:DUF2785 domain-containing protein n=1 Tax=Agrilutibacter terrestris TaxID=2865112 RepID=A0A7H0FVE2_9GAMM|nr:DUF2785 domain-containing protein [Lysobacter terrestris]QNP40008.1 DUF2785 domain-containing protein [Lysobacter terrestris]
MLRTFRRFLLATCLLPVGLAPAFAGAACPPAGSDRASLQALKAADFALADTAARERLALGLAGCLGDPDPALRDGIAFEALSTWMRRQQLSDATLAALRDRLRPLLVAEDPRGFQRPFAALVLAEVARTDRIRPWLDAAQREQLVADAVDYLCGVRDYRGYVDGEGWRHGVAHGADFALQLALNPALDAGQLERLRDAVAAQVAPAGHAYIHGESLRLARPIVFIARRDLHDAGDWQRWLQAVAAPAPLPDWNAAFASEAGMVRRHDVLAFVTALYLLAQEQDDAATRERLLPGLRAVLKEMP